MNKGIFIIIILCSIQCFAQQQTYDELLQDIERTRKSKQIAYTNAVSAEEKNTIITESRVYIYNTLTDKIFPFWYGTQWDFNGHTKTPKKGKIACGYFITTTLEDMGFNIPRYKWAQSASEIFIKKLAGNAIKRFTNASVKDVEEYLLPKGNGLYLVGLDDHTGYILVKDQEVRFIHSSYYQPEIGVMSEALNTENPLKYSKYRIIGKLLSDTMIINWITNLRYQ
ncbi:hypothetical protein [Aquimarina litoralis]|uniref:hypothetical protein n=1 Tax=Aquimarina litoralis TaxID=584605 RepID=UPI001C55F62E|nr:hypothetical protein [Aquimarina litoralis]MBW1297008.1 hypothetical protein [Aquimarina litoralis]